MTDQQLKNKAKTFDKLLERLYHEYIHYDKEFYYERLGFIVDQDIDEYNNKEK